MSLMAILGRTDRPDFTFFRQMVIACVVGMFLLTVYAACMGPQMMQMVFVLGIVLCVGFVVLHFPLQVCVGWLVLVGTTPEFWFSDIMPGTENTVTAIVKVVGLGLVGLCILYYGFRFDYLNPGFAFGTMFLVGLVHGLMRQLSFGESVRSLIGSAAPYAFSFSRLSRKWCQAMIMTTVWLPSMIVLFGILLAGAGLRPMFGDLEGVLRLQASTHPAFLGGYAMIGAYAATMELYRDGRASNLAALLLNMVILVLSGARAPLFCAVVLVAFAFFALPSETFPVRRRVLPLIIGSLGIPLTLVMSAGNSSIRIFNVLEKQAGNLSGRDLIWPLFRDAWDRSPIFGWGVGAGKMTVDPDSMLAKLLGTTAAHNEYLRIGVEGGYFGLGLLMLVMALWTIRWTVRARLVERYMMRLIMILFAIQSITDNTLIAATASVFFTWSSAVYARAALEYETERAVRRQARWVRSMASGRMRAAS